MHLYTAHFDKVMGFWYFCANIIYCSCFRYTGRLFLGCALFLARCNTMNFMRKSEGKIELQKKVHRGICVRDITFLNASYPFHALLLLSSSTPSPFPNDALTEWLLDTYIAIGGILRDDIMSKLSRIQKSIIQYYTVFL